MSKDPDIVPEASHLIILDKNISVCMAKNGNDTNHTRHITRGVYFVRNGDSGKMHNIEWRERGLQLADIATKSVG